LRGVGRRDTSREAVPARLREQGHAHHGQQAEPGDDHEIVIVEPPPARMECEQYGCEPGTQPGQLIASEAPVVSAAGAEQLRAQCGERPYIAGWITA